MKGAAGMSRPRRRPPSGERSNAAPLINLSMENAPLRRKGLRAVRSPSFTARLFSGAKESSTRLHAAAARAMLTEGLVP